MIHQPKYWINFETTIIISDSFYNFLIKNENTLKLNSLKICTNIKNNIIIINQKLNKMSSKFSMDMHKVITVSHNDNDKDNRKNNIHEHHRSGSLTDSEESESSLSCDSLNCSEFVQSIDWNTETCKITFLPDSLLNDIRSRQLNRQYINKNDNANYLNYKKNNNDDHNNITEKKTCILIKHNDSGSNDKKLSHTYENDRYYTFHINEKTFENVVGIEKKFVKDESFAGYADFNTSNSTIRSSKGTVRGVKNRVRNGIATFLQMQVASVKTYREKDLGKVILYTTSMGIVRNTFAKCSNMKQILRTLLIHFEERDVFMSTEYQQEIKERMKSDEIDVPQLFVEGQHIGDSETIERLNENGELRKMLQPYKSINAPLTCQTCGGYRLLPCPSCNGSKKSMHRNHFTAEFVALKCMNCDEVGLVKCHNC